MVHVDAPLCSVLFAPMVKPSRAPRRHISRGELPVTTSLTGPEKRNVCTSDLRARLFKADAATIQLREDLRQLLTQADLVLDRIRELPLK